MARVTVFGLPLDPLTFDDSLAACTRLVESGQFAQHVVINVSKVLLCVDDPSLRKGIWRADLVNADGMGIVWAGRALGILVPERVTGIDLMQALMRVAESRGWPVYLLGAKPEVLKDLIAFIANEYPRLEIAGYRDGYFNEDAKVAADVRASGAKILFLGLPSPRKEQFVEAQRAGFGPLLTFGVGGSFDVLAGRTQRAPRWLQEVGGEWFFRLTQEPGRMWRRYLIGNARFARLVAQEYFRKRPK